MTNIFYSNDEQKMRCRVICWMVTLLALCLPSIAADKLEQQAQGLIRDTRASIGQASQTHMQECLKSSSVACETIVNNANDLAQLERQLEQYCGWPAYTMQNTCKPHRSKKVKLKKLVKQSRKDQTALKRIQ